MLHSKAPSSRSRSPFFLPHAGTSPNVGTGSEVPPDGTLSASCDGGLSLRTDRSRMPAAAVILSARRVRAVTGERARQVTEFDPRVSARRSCDL